MNKLLIGIVCSVIDTIIAVHMPMSDPERKPMVIYNADPTYDVMQRYGLDGPIPEASWHAYYECKSRMLHSRIVNLIGIILCVDGISLLINNCNHKSHGEMPPPILSSTTIQDHIRIG